MAQSQNHDFNHNMTKVHNMNRKGILKNLTPQVLWNIITISKAQKFNTTKISAYTVHIYIHTYVHMCNIKDSYTAYIHMQQHACFRDSHKVKDDYKKPIEYDNVIAEAASIQGSPTGVSYAATTVSKDTGPVLQYDYARTGPIKVR